MPPAYTLSHIPLGRMRQLVEAHGNGDDWTGIKDAATRRKIQNRLNVRAYRRRKARQSQETPPSDVPSSPSQRKTRNFDSHTPFWVEDRQIVCLFPASPTTARNKKEPLIPNTLATTSIIFPLCPDHLITLLQYNALRACITNHMLLLPIILETSSPTQECATAAEHVLPTPSIPSSVPPSLHPTDLQRTIPHESWVDIIPHPLWRDNVLRSLGTFDEDELWSDSIGGLFDGFPDDEIEKRGVIAWNPPWDICGWEVSEEFWRKWGWLMRGCEREVQEATNHWRLMRGEEPVKWVREV